MPPHPRRERVDLGHRGGRYARPRRVRDVCGPRAWRKCPVRHGLVFPKEGRWSSEWYDTASTGGRFVRADSSFRSWIRADGSTPFAPEAGRYHLYVSLACPWAHRTLIARRLKGLAGALPAPGRPVGREMISAGFFRWISRHPYR